MLRTIEGIESRDTIVRFQTFEDKEYIKVFYQDGSSHYFDIELARSIRAIETVQAQIYVEQNIWKLAERSNLEEALGREQNKKSKENRAFITLGIVGGIVCAASTSFDQTTTLTKASLGTLILAASVGTILNEKRNSRISMLQGQLDELDYVEKYSLFLANLRELNDVLPRYLHRDASIDGRNVLNVPTINTLDSYTLEQVKHSIGLYSRVETAERGAYQRYLQVPRQEIKY